MMPSYSDLERKIVVLGTQLDNSVKTNRDYKTAIAELEATKLRLIDEIARLNEDNATLRDAVHVVARDLMRLATN